jgi:hypothetical protein
LPGASEIHRAFQQSNRPVKYRHDATSVHAQLAHTATLADPFSTRLLWIARSASAFGRRRKDGQLVRQLPVFA